MDKAAEMQLVEELEQGSQAAWTQVVTQHRSRLLAQFSRYPTLQTRYGYTPEDLLQELWLCIPNRLKSYNGRAPLGYWLRLQARSVAGDLLKRYKPKDTLWQTLPETGGIQEPSHGETPEEVLMEVELHRACNLFHEMAHLPVQVTGALPSDFTVNFRYKQYVNNWINR